jgi:hypothetical protein
LQFRLQLSSSTTADWNYSVITTSTNQAPGTKIPFVKYPMPPLHDGTGLQW